MMKRCTKVDLKAPTSVFWDIDKCPVPAGSDAHQVYPCIKRFLRNEGYSGPLSITAVGNLTNVPHDVLRTLSSTGIHLTHTVPRDCDVFGLLFAWAADFDLPANVMVISTEKRDYGGFGILSRYGLNLIYDFPHTTFKVPGPLEEEDKCSDTGGWKCILCDDRTGLGAESLIKHFSSREHKRNHRACLPKGGCSIHCLDTLVEAPPLDSATLVEATTPLDIEAPTLHCTTLVEAPTLDSTKVKKQPKAKKKNSGKRKEQMEEQKGREKRKKMEEQEEEGRGKRLKRKKMEDQEEEGRGKRLKIEEQKGKGKSQKMEDMKKNSGKVQEAEDLKEEEWEEDTAMVQFF